MLIILSIFIFGSIVACYFYLTRNYNYWRDRNIPCAKDTVPGFGHTWPLFTMRLTLYDLIKQICSDYLKQSMVGFYHLTTPALVIREPELVKTVLQKNFASFSKNIWKIDPQADRLIRLNPFFTYGDTWLISRKHLSVASSAKSLKTFFHCIEQVCGNLQHFLDDKLRKNNNVIEFEVNNLACKYTAAVASLVNFSVENMRFDEDDSHSLSLTNIAETILGTNFFSLINQTLIFYFYDVTRFLGVKFVSEKIDDLFSGTVKEITHVREQEESVRKFDILQLMLDLKETKAIEDNMVAAHTFTFHMNISETSSVTLGFTCYQISRHPHVQQKLRDEIKSVLANYDDQLTYDALKEMTYMDQVLKESQRVYPTVPCFGKLCTEEFELKGSDGLSCRVQPGTEIFINVYEMHRNPKYWSNPDVFDPDRFASDKKIDRYIFLPFGEGPRICPGRKLALLQSKAYLAMILKNYTLELSPKTPKEPFKFLPGRFLISTVGGLWVNFKPL